MDQFDGDVIIRQLRSLQVLETVHLMAGGEPLLTNLSSIMAIKNLAIKGADSFRNKQLIHVLKWELFLIGIPHRMRYKSFNNRYKIFFGHTKPYQLDTQQDQCKVGSHCIFKGHNSESILFNTC